MASKLGVRIGRRLRARRDAQGMTQAELAERVGLSENYISAVERGAKLPTVVTLDALAKALGARPGDLVGSSSQDAWLEELLAVGSSVPGQLRPVALAVLRAVAASSKTRS